MRRTSHLGAAQLAEAAVMADIAVLLVFLGLILPLGSALVVASVTPFAVLAMRHGPRTVGAAAFASGGLLFLLFGLGGALQEIVLAGFGLVIGTGFKRGWRRSRVIGVSLLTVWTATSASALALLVIFSESRELILEQVLIAGRSAANLLERFGVDPDTAAVVTDVTEWLVDHWVLFIPLLLLFVLAFVAWVADTLSEPALVRVDRSLAAPRRDEAHTDERAPVDPLPVTLDRVSLRYPGTRGEDCEPPAAYDETGRKALDDVSLTVRPATFVAVIGANGSGKSSLLSILAGATPTTGTVDRPGAVGAGRPGGTAIVLQRPETQVLGVHVRDDLTWGMEEERAASVDVHGLLALVGLADHADRETAALSGGELQRLAIASGLAHDPAILLSDEPTTMLDPEGRTSVMELLRSLPNDRDVAVVHVTHHLDEIAGADTVVALVDGRIRACGRPEAVLAEVVE